MPFTDSIKMADIIVSDERLITATPADVVSGKIYIGTTQTLESGIMPIATSHGDITLLAGESHSVPYGKIPAAYTVKSEALSSQTSGTAVAKEILINKTAWVNGKKVTGTMPNIGSESETLMAGTSHTISKGYHDGTGVIKARSLSDQTPGNAVDSQILYGKIAWVNGSSVTGTMPNIGSESETLSAGASHTISLGYHNGTGVIKAQDLASQTQATAASKDIVEGYTAWVNGEKITGSISKIKSETITLPINGTYVIPKGYHAGSGVVTQSVPTAEGQTVASAFDSQTLDVAGKYMTSNIIVTGINALNYKRPNTYATDSNGNLISGYDLVVSDNTAIIKLTVDNWHDNATMNNYHLTFTDLISKDNTNVSLDCVVCIDWGNSATQDYTYKFNGVTIKMSLEENTNAHTFTISNIKSGKITITELFASRQFGDSHDVD